MPELQSLEDQRNRDNNSNINNFTGGYRPNANRERNLSENKTNDKKIKLLDHSKYSKRKEKYDIFVGNMPYGIDEVELKEWFEKNGLKNIEFDARMVIDKETGNSRGFGFVSVFKKENVADVLKLNGKEFKHRKLIINESRK